MDREGSVVQVAILLMIITILGVALLSKGNVLTNRNRGGDETSGQQTRIQGLDSKNVNTKTTNTQEGSQPGTETGGQNTKNQVEGDKVIVEKGTTITMDVVKAYFAALSQGSFTSACGYVSPTQCTPTNANSVANFAKEYKKLRKGYEFLSIKDFGIMSPSGKDVICVKYAYTYKDDINPKQVWEILSFYVEPSATDPNRLQISARVCEKKYKDGLGERPCPVQAVQPYCTELMKG